MVLVVYSYIADLIFGDPEWLPHPVRGIGKVIEWLDRMLNKKDTLWMGRLKGMILAFIVTGISGFLAYLFITTARKLHPLVGNLAGVYLGYTTLSVKDLFLKSKAVLEKIEANSLREARIKLSQIVGRDTQNLCEDKIVKAAIESIAESTNDGIVAPLFYLMLGGPVLAMAYKAINTLDSMVGYKNERYFYFGWFSAKLDDIANFFPARITGILVCVSSFIAGKGFRSACRIMLRDARKHPSPNSGISESAMAGVLGIRLGGPYAYQGEIYHKPYLGEEKMPINPLLINEALKISFITSLLMVSAGVILRWAI